MAPEKVFLEALRIILEFSLAARGSKLGVQGPRPGGGQWAKPPENVVFFSYF